MNNKIIFLVLILSILNLAKSKKKILVNIFPGAKSHNFVMKELFDYSIRAYKEKRQMSDEEFRQLTWKVYPDWQ